MIKYLGKRITFHRIYDPHRGYYYGRVKGKVEEVKGKNFRIRDNWYYKDDVFNITLIEYEDATEIVNDSGKA